MTVLGLGVPALEEAQVVIRCVTPHERFVIPKAPAASIAVCTAPRVGRHSTKWQVVGQHSTKWQVGHVTADTHGHSVQTSPHGSYVIIFTLATIGFLQGFAFGCLFPHFRFSSATR